MQRLVRATVLLAMMATASGCFAWKTVGALPRSADLPADTRITKYDGTVIVLAQSRIENDTIRGYVDGSHYRHVIPLAAVDFIEAREFRAKESLIAGTLVGGMVYLVVKGLQATQPFGPIPTPP
jgi:hypothetical protein